MRCGLREGAVHGRRRFVPTGRRWRGRPGHHPRWRTGRAAGRDPGRGRDPRRWRGHRVRPEHLVGAGSRGGRALVRRGHTWGRLAYLTRAADGARVTLAPAKGKTFTRAVITGPNAIRMEEVPVPEIGRSQILVRMRAAALCTWEQRTYAGIDTYSYPLVGGHENSGVVVAIGPDVELAVEVGDQVALSGLRRCAQCYSCRRGVDNICDNARSKRVPDQPWGPGGFGEYVAAEGYQVYKVGPVATPLEAALTEPTSCVLHDMKRHPVTNGDIVVIVGAGIMGLLHLVMARRTPSFIIVSEPEAARREKAKELGADALIDPSTEDYVKRVGELSGGNGANITYITIGHPP